MISQKSLRDKESLKVATHGKNDDCGYLTDTEDEACTDASQDKEGAQSKG